MRGHEDIEAIYRDAEASLPARNCQRLTRCCRFAETGREPYVTRAEVLRQGADWFVAHEVGAVTEPSAELADAGGNKYSFVRSYPSHELSGMTWRVYRASAALTGR